MSGLFDQFGNPIGAKGDNTQDGRPLDNNGTQTQEDRSGAKHTLSREDFKNPVFSNSSFRELVEKEVAKLPTIDGRECVDKKFGDLYYSFFIWSRNLKPNGGKALSKLYPGMSESENFLTSKEGLLDTAPFMRILYSIRTIMDKEDSLAEKFTLIVQSPYQRRGGLATSEFRNMIEKYIMECLDPSIEKRPVISKGGKDFINNYLQALKSTSPGDSIQKLAIAFGEFVEKQQYRKIKDFRNLFNSSNANSDPKTTDAKGGWGKRILIGSIIGIASLVGISVFGTKDGKSTTDTPKPDPAAEAAAKNIGSELDREIDARAAARTARAAEEKAPSTPAAKPTHPDDKPAQKRPTPNTPATQPAKQDDPYKDADGNGIADIFEGKRSAAIQPKENAIKLALSRQPRQKFSWVDFGNSTNPKPTNKELG